MNYPQPIKQRALNNPRLGIKSSLPNPRKVIALIYLIYVCSGKKASVNYLVSNPLDKNKATLDQDLTASIISFLGKNEDFSDSLLSNPLIDSQIEALQVAMQLFFRLAKINFTSAAQSERSGRNRYPKTIDFSTNMDVLDLFLGQFNQPQKKEFLSNWLNDEDDEIISPLIKKLLVTFVEPTIFRITESDNKFMDFDLLGMYESFLKKGMSSVDYKGEVEPKGTARVLGSYIRNGLHPYINQHGGSAEINMDLITEFKEYSKRVDTSLSIAPKLDDYPFDGNSPNDVETVEQIFPLPLQQIFFGAPGVGKSHHLKSVYKNEDDVIRITFHPETDYSSFVGCYKPQSEGNEIVYKFQGQAFTEAYVKAWKRYVGDDERKDTFLVIEEINRGNCAQIFGDIFQLLDRNDQGFSDYSIIPDKDLQTYLHDQFVNIADALGKINKDVSQGTVMVLPPNLHILATMNTSDQSLFPIDSAFKRRWDWVYMPIETTPPNTGGKREIHTDKFAYDWGEFLTQVNKRIHSSTLSEDKQLGFWFVKPKGKDGIISVSDFVSKVVFFLWNDIYKDYVDDASSIFNFAEDGNPDSKEKTRHTFRDFIPKFQEVNEYLVDAFIKNLGVTAKPIKPTSNSAHSNSEEGTDENSN